MKAANIIHLIAGTAHFVGASFANAESFDKQEALQGISFHVTSPNKAAGNTVRIVPAGLQIENSPIEMDINGIVKGADVADVNADRSPEIYIYVLEPGVDNQMSLVAFSANRKKSLSQISLPALAATKGSESGYCGHDHMALTKGKFVRRFPLSDKTSSQPGKRGNSNTSSSRANRAGS